MSEKTYWTFRSLYDGFTITKEDDGSDADGDPNANRFAMSQLADRKMVMDDGRALDTWIVVSAPTEKPTLGDRLHDKWSVVTDKGFRVWRGESDAWKRARAEQEALRLEEQAITQAANRGRAGGQIADAMAAILAAQAPAQAQGAKR